MKDDTSLPLSLPLMESFYTLQGEGFYAGQAAYFIRLAGCDVGCVWCDVKDSWEAEKYPTKNVNEIVKEAALFPSRLAVVTGGEPLMYELSALTNALQVAGFRTHIETSGVYPISGSWDWVCFSPKKFKKPHPSIFPVANELKIIISHSSDFSFAEKYAQEVKKDCLLFLQVEWSKREKLLPSVVAYIQKNPRWRISTQTHKYLDIP